MSEGLAKGLYGTAKVRIESMTLRKQGGDGSTAPPHLTCVHYCIFSRHSLFLGLVSSNSLLRFYLFFSSSSSSFIFYSSGSYSSYSFSFFFFRILFPLFLLLLFFLLPLLSYSSYTPLLPFLSSSSSSFIVYSSGSYSSYSFSFFSFESSSSAFPASPLLPSSFFPLLLLFLRFFFVFIGRSLPTRLPHGGQSTGSGGS